ncbi:glycosyltransferase family 2 protein [Alteromonas gilva]|uniref:Glycosyltransferase n=1 Tax=Alteromonas gilva TaxID=2987522 RepID=A0ABT5L7H3_9ALTE|nr:glycosyltransferase [Alteromonas gilva]MDC8833014.1 glycosyltransferase [Alteromonas gilva]
MKRTLKSVVKKLLGSSPQQLVTIDTVAKTLDGYCVIGWYFTDLVSSVKVTDSNNQTVDAITDDIERADVAAVTGKQATGFQILLTTKVTLDELTLVATLKNGQSQTYALSSANVEASQLAAPIKSTTKGQNCNGACEFAVVTGTHVFVSGWLTDTRRATSLALNKKSNAVTESDYDIFRFMRNDVVEAYGKGPHTSAAGYCILFTLDKKLDKNEKQLNLVFTIDGNEEEMSVNQVFWGADEPMTNTKRILNNWAPSNPAHLAKADIVSTPVLELYANTAKATSVRYDFGEQVQTPKASIIIPLYGRYDFIRYQMSHFNRSGEARQCEIIYVIDDPSIASPAMQLARYMAQMVSHPFSVVKLSDNVGFGRANNIGVEHARADNLILMNSDVLPKSVGWLDKMLSSLDAPDTGIVGARLLFEDGSIQHDGMAPVRLQEYPGLLFNDHPYKGWAVKLSPHAAEEAPCQLITAACWALRKADFEAAGGFDPAYVLGDFEDSDLCLKIEEMGKTNKIRRDAEFYHLERQSQNLVEAGKWKHNLTIVNAVTFNKRWKQKLEAMQAAG